MRKADIDKLMHMLSREQRAKAYEVLIADARCSFALPNITVSSMEEFIGTCARFCAHCAKRVMPPADPTPSWSRDAAVRILAEDYPGGMDMAYMAAKERINGDIFTVLDAITEVIREQRAKEYFEYALHECVDTMDPDDVLELMTQFVSKFGDIVCQGDGPPSPASLVPGYAQLIRVFVKMLASIAHTLRSVPPPADEETTSPRSIHLPKADVQT